VEGDTTVPRNPSQNPKEKTADKTHSNLDYAIGDLIDFACILIISSFSYV
jgi:hypothetical protein